MNRGDRPERRFSTYEEFDINGLDVARWASIRFEDLRTHVGYPTARHASHAITLRTLLRHAWQLRSNVLVFEDDLVINSDRLGTLELDNLPEDWKILYFGCLHTEAPVPVSNSLVKVAAALDTHAFGVRCECIPDLLRLLSPRNVNYRKHPQPTDVRMLDFQREHACYAVFPNAIGQAPLESDINGGVNLKYHEDCSQAWNAEVLEGLDMETSPVLLHET
ncbi:hypothetical protein WKV53_27110 [Luteolibacter sp. Y139]|uniref:Glycosyl transferase n=2 Tax=Luteolibacter soli TaxID=3135280 RepID=A0ABU9B5G6_9BACT